MTDVTDPKPKPKLISTKVDFTRPDPDAFDPIAWFEGTGEDLGLPEGYVEKYNADVAERLARLKAEDDPPG